ncbi:MAG: type IV secretion system protein, partial [Rickettsiales bacterium]|nr:type IV secretion system protein [Rickettsiales bacterium]
MGKIFKLFLIFVVFFNTLFGNMEDSSALSTFGGSVVGPRDRVRKYKDINFEYDRNSGFSCKPSGLVFFKPTENTSSTGVDLKASAIAFEVFSSLMLYPILCVSIVNNFLRSGQSSKMANLTGGLFLIISLVAASGLAALEEMLLEEDDFNLDPTNKYCLGIQLTMMVSCIAITAVFKLPISSGKKILLIFVINATAMLAKTVTSYVMYKFGERAFDKLALCGDNWLTYGNIELQEQLESDGINGKIDVSYIKQHFPTKGEFKGSYKYTLTGCFGGREASDCKKLFGDSFNINNLSAYFTTVYKQYREFVYDGIEYAYSGCEDPRTERGGYLGTSNRTSQLYYFRGNEAANFACDRFTTKYTEEYRRAYTCCLEASQKTVCVENVAHNHYTMCNRNEECNARINAAPTTFSSIVANEIKSIARLLGLSVSDSEIENRDINVCTSLRSDLNKIDGLDNAQKDEIYAESCDENGNPKGNTASSEQQSDEGISGVWDTKNVITLKITKSVHSDNKYCVETYDLCPYNFRLLGGTEVYGSEFSPSHTTGVSLSCNGSGDARTCEEDTTINEIKMLNNTNNCTFEEEGGVKRCMGPCFETIGEDTKIYECYKRPSNFCQIDRHCVTIKPLYEKESVVASPYVDKACLNFIGSSHNFEGYANPVIATENSKALTAPIAECVTETFKNILLNRAGHTRCTNNTEISFDDKTCDSGVVYKRGQNLDETTYPSPVKTLQRYLFGVVRAILALAIVLYGYNMIIPKKGAENPEKIMKFILSLIFVSYFSLSSNWFMPVFNAVYSISNEVAVLGMELLGDNKEDYNYTNLKYSGCYFLENNHIPNNYETYGPRKYLAVFDTLDCKLSRYFGYYTQSMSNPPIVSLLVAGVISCGILILIILPLVLLFVSLLYFSVRVLFTFIAATMTLSILLFVSPIFIPLYLFERTKQMFDGWIKAIIKNTFIPLFLIMGTFLFFVVFDKIFVGDAVFYGEREPIRDVYCGKICKPKNGGFFFISKNATDAE